MFLSILNAEIVACILLFGKSRHKRNLKSTSKYGFFPDLGEKMAAFWACACKLSWTLFSPARVQPLYGAGRKESSGTALPLSSYANFIFSLHKLKTKALVMCVRSKKTSVFFWLCFMITNMITERKNESEFLLFSPVEFCKNLSDVINNTKLQ